VAPSTNSDGFVELLGLDLRAKGAAVLTVVAAAEDGYGLSGERIALEVLSGLEPDDAGLGGSRGHGFSWLLRGLGTTVMTLYVRMPAALVGEGEGGGRRRDGADEDLVRWIRHGRPVPRRPAIMSVTARSNSSPTMRSFQHTAVRTSHTGM
jgi:hypothetical protein